MSTAEEFFAKLSEIADDMGLDENDHEHFVNSGMQKKGFKAIMQWTDPDPEPENNEKPDWFSSNQKRTRKIDNKNSRSTGTFGASYND